MPRSVIFDLDGTLVDSIPGIQWSVDAALAACGMPPAACDLRPLIGPPIRDILAAVSGASDSLLDRMTSEFRAVYDSAGWRKTACQPGAADVVERLSLADCSMWVITNKPGHAARAILGELAMAHRFQEIISRDSRAPAFTSKTEMLANLLERCGLNRGDSIMVGDTLEDCRAAAENGIECVLVPHGYGGGLDGPLPKGCRPISSWNELLMWCEAVDHMLDTPGMGDYQ